MANRSLGFYRRWMGGLGLLLGLMACRLVTSSEPTAVLPASPFPSALVTHGATLPPTPQVRYYLLSERTAQIIEIDPQAPVNGRQLRLFNLAIPDAGNAGPEGLTFVPNAVVAQTGLFGLPSSANGGYFVVSVQKTGKVYLFDLPLATMGEATAVALVELTVPGLGEDASALDYADGFLWLAMAKDQLLFQVVPSLSAAGVVVHQTYRLNQLPYAADDIEGIVFAGPGQLVLADDRGHRLSLYDNFPACLAAKSCQRLWVHPVDRLEPSGVAWDPVAQLLVWVDDGGTVWTLTLDGDQETLVLQTPYDLEGVAVMVGGG